MAASLPPTCFVCLDDAPALIAPLCACRTWAHATCLLRAIERVPAHADGACPVCLAPYACVRRAVRVNGRFAAAACAALLSATVAVAGVAACTRYALAHLFDPSPAHLTNMSVALVLVFSAMLLLVWSAHATCTTPVLTTQVRLVGDDGV